MARKYKRDSKGRFAGGGGGMNKALAGKLRVGSSRATLALAGGAIALRRASPRAALALGVAANVNATIGGARSARG